MSLESRATLSPAQCALWLLPTSLAGPVSSLGCHFPWDRETVVETVVLHTSVVDQVRAPEVGRTAPQVGHRLTQNSQGPPFPSWALLHNAAAALHKPQG